MVLNGHASLGRSNVFSAILGGAHRLVKLVASAFEPEQRGIRNRLRDREAVLDREDRVGGAMDDE